MISRQITTESFALQVADFFRRKDWPFLSVEVKPGKPFPLVTLRDDNASVSRIIACTCDEAELANAACFASVMAAVEMVSFPGRYVISCGVWPGGWREHG